MTERHKIKELREVLRMVGGVPWPCVPTFKIIHTDCAGRIERTADHLICAARRKLRKAGIDVRWDGRYWCWFTVRTGEGVRKLSELSAIIAALKSLKGA